MPVHLCTQRTVKSRHLNAVASLSLLLFARAIQPDVVIGLLPIWKTTMITIFPLLEPPCQVLLYAAIMPAITNYKLYGQLDDSGAKATRLTKGKKLSSYTFSIFSTSFALSAVDMRCAVFKFNRFPLMSSSIKDSLAPIASARAAPPSGPNPFHDKLHIFRRTFSCAVKLTLYHQDKLKHSAP